MAFPITDMIEPLKKKSSPHLTGGLNQSYKPRIQESGTIIVPDQTKSNGFNAVAFCFHELTLIQYSCQENIRKVFSCTVTITQIKRLYH